MNHRISTLIVQLIALFALSGCYYMQAASGQLEVLRKREPVAEVLADEDTPPEVGRRLRLVQDARDYSIAELGLPDNDSYRTYADLERPFVVWSVFAAEEFSLTPKTWCYPIAGCVSYRGYFKAARAEAVAARLRGDGFDTYVGGVAAYSTLGKFNDPVLNTMMRWDDLRLVGVLFHELAHQQLYVKNDTAFNESFATAVEEIGLGRYLRDRDRAADFATYEERKAFRRTVMTLVNATREDLSEIYDYAIDADEKRLLKEHRIEQLTHDLRTALSATGRETGAWLDAPFNNARLASFSLYEGYLPAFRRMFAECGEDLTCFYAEANRVAELPAAARTRTMEDLLTPPARD